MFRAIDLFRRIWSAKEPSGPNPNDAEGLQIVSPHHDEASVDIVAVHGLGGHPYGTWTHDNRIMWLRDLLPLDISDARIMTWGYDSEAQTARHFTSMMMYSHPHDLLSALYSLRQDTKSNDRPIIFLCHSFGGVVVKEALLRASMAIPKYDKHLKTIQICTKGIIFLGTPQQSTQETSLGKIIRYLASSAISREGLLTSLEVESDRLELQLEQFKSICTGLSNYYCYERRPTRNARKVDFIVSKASATIGSSAMNDSHCVAIDKDHRNMVKYQSSGDPDYRLVLDLVCRLRKSNGWMKHSEERAIQVQKNCLDHGHPEANFKVPTVLDHRRNKSFTGREGALAHLHSCVSSSHSTNDSSSIVVIQGMGGVGKTQLAREYVYRYESSFDSVWWIDAQSLQSTHTGFFNMAQRLADHYAGNPDLWAPSIADISRSLKKAENQTDGWGQNQMDMKQPALIVEAVKEWLCCKGNDHWLLIFDNVDDLETFNIADFVPETRSGNIIMTSRCREVSRFGQDILLDVMGESESISLLSKSCRRDTLSSDMPDYAQAAELVAALGHIPLAIVQAGAYIWRGDISFDSYLKAFREESLHVETMLNSRLIDLDAVYTPCALSFQIIEKKSPQAADLLLLCSFLSSENIPKDMLSCGLQLKRGVSSLKSQLYILSKYFLIMPSERDDSFNIHYLVQAWARDRQNPGQQRSNVERAVVAIATAAGTIREPESRRRVFERQILPHIRHCLDHLLPASVSSVGYHYWSILGSVCKHQDKHEDAEKLYRYAKEDLDGKPALENEKAMVLVQLASICIARGRTSEAEKLSRQVLDHTGIRVLRLLSLINLASVYESQSRFQEAQQYSKVALDQCEDIFGPNDFRTLRLVDHLANLYQEQGQYERAEFLLQRELLSFEAHVGSDHPETIMAQGRLAILCEEQGKYEETEALLERSLNTHERVLGSDHPKTLSIVASLAAVYDLQGNFAESQPLYVRALKGTERTLGPKHRETLNIRENMALNCHVRGKYKEAEVIYQDVLEARLSRPYNAEDIERTKARLADLYKQQGSQKDL